MTTLTTRRATCACGSLELGCEGDPVRISICHCLDCQRRTGSPFGQQARWPIDRVTPKGEEKTWVRTADSGGKVTFHFCPTCGTTVYYEIGALPGFVGVPVGGFADPKFPAPTVSVYETRRHPWTATPGITMERFD